MSRENVSIPTFDDALHDAAGNHWGKEVNCILLLVGNYNLIGLILFRHRDLHCTERPFNRVPPSSDSAYNEVIVAFFCPARIRQ